MKRPRLLDLFCGAGGTSVGYHRAGFDVTGVDHDAQKNYPFAFIRADALAYVAAHGHEYAAIAASPPCQRYSRVTHVRGDRDAHPDLLAPTREALIASGRPWVIENVVGAPLRNPILLCGTMFGLQVFRHRLFEMSFFCLTPPHGRHIGTTNSHRWAGAEYDDLRGGYVTVTGGGNCRVATARRAMGIDWMTKRELNQAIPPEYTAFVGAALLRDVQHGATARRHQGDAR